MTTHPTAAELVAAVAMFLETDVRAACDGQVGFHARVAANALRIVERELLCAAPSSVHDALTELGVADEAELTESIRAGDLDGRADDVMACLRLLVAHRLSIDHPGYADG